MPKIKICKEMDCHNTQTTDGYCRLHYLKNWKKIKKDTDVKAAKKLNRYIESVCKKNPERYVETIREDLKSKSFSKRIEDQFSELDDLYHVFNEPTYEEEVERLIQDLKIEKKF